MRRCERDMRTGEGKRKRVRKCSVAICTDREDDQSRPHKRKKRVKNRAVWLKKATVLTFIWFWQ